MKPVNFPGANIDLKAPEGLEKQVKTIRGYKDVDNDKLPYIVTVWEPTPEEKEAIVNGASICLKVVGETMPPVALFCVDFTEGDNQ